MQDDNTPLLKAFFQSKWIRLILVIDIVAILTVIVIFIHNARKVSTIYFNVAPIDATISVNGDTHFENGQFSIAPGKYEIKISREGLETRTISVDIGASDYTSINTFLTGPDSSFDFYKERKNYDSYRRLRKVASIDNDDTSLQEFVSEYDHILSVFKELPIIGFVYADPSINSSTAGFTIKSGLDEKKCEKSSCLLVNYYGKGYESEVANEVKKAGYNPEDYQIVYERYSK